MNFMFVKRTFLFSTFAILILLIAIFAVFFSPNDVSDSVIKIGFPGPWNSTHPGLQHTLYGDLLLSNQFDSLVGVAENGQIVPLGAKSWKISSNSTIFEFQIDTSKTFPDGSTLTSSDYKRSWENSAKLMPISANKSVQDVLYKIVGYEQISQTDQIVGIETPDARTLIVKFKSPFRVALEQLIGNRYSAYKQINGQFMGTGNFILESLSKTHVKLHPRKDLLESGHPTVEVIYLSRDQIMEDFKNQLLDVIFYVPGSSIDFSKINFDQDSLLAGPESIHLSMALNTANSLFQEQKYRQAFLYLVKTELAKNQSYLPKKEVFTQDFQFYLPAQSGRIDELSVDEIINQGQNWEDELRELTKKHPIRVKSGKTGRDLFRLIEKLGLELHKDSGTVATPQEYVDIVYGKDGPDIFMDGFSVSGIDPDSLYHRLGKNGAIRTPYSNDDEVAALLETGRNLLNIEDLDQHYQKVSIALLNNVPIVHIGFIKPVTVYKKHRVKVSEKTLRRNQGQLHFFKKNSSIF